MLAHHWHTFLQVQASVLQRLMHLVNLTAKALHLKFGKITQSEIKQVCKFLWDKCPNDFH